MYTNRTGHLLERKKENLSRGKGFLYEKGVSVKVKEHVGVKIKRRSLEMRWDTYWKEKDALTTRGKGQLQR